MLEDCGAGEASGGVCELTRGELWSAENKRFDVKKLL